MRQKPNRSPSVAGTCGGRAIRPDLAAAYEQVNAVEVPHFAAHLAVATTVVALQSLQPAGTHILHPEELGVPPVGVQSTQPIWAAQAAEVRPSLHFPALRQVRIVVAAAGAGAAIE
jgi:hypothetical protein